MHVILFGFVQGMGFRNYIYNKSKSLDIKGWVKNLDNDKVEAIFEGEKDDISKVLKYCVKGHLFAKVKYIKINEEKFKREKEFKIL